MTGDISNAVVESSVSSNDDTAPNPIPSPIRKITFLTSGLLSAHEAIVRAISKKRKILRLISIDFYLFYQDCPYIFSTNLSNRVLQDQELS